jgi:hypothetical protein
MVKDASGHRHRREEPCTTNLTQPLFQNGAADLEKRRRRRKK